jgi:hypothetical protein
MSQHVHIFPQNVVSVALLRRGAMWHVCVNTKTRDGWLQHLEDFPSLRQAVDGLTEFVGDDSGVSIEVEEGD